MKFLVSVTRSQQTINISQNYEVSQSQNQLISATLLSLSMAGKLLTVIRINHCNLQQLFCRSRQTSVVDMPTCTSPLSLASRKKELASRKKNLYAEKKNLRADKRTCKQKNRTREQKMNWQTEKKTCK